MPPRWRESEKPNCIWVHIDEYSCVLFCVSHCTTQVTGDTVYNMLRLAEVECNSDERPLNPHKIRTTEVFPISSSLKSFRTATFRDLTLHYLTPSQVLHSPFDDIVPRESKKSKKDKDKEETKKAQSKATKWVIRLQQCCRNSCKNEMKTTI